MSRRYANNVVAILQADVEIAAWATGGILDRDPRRSGPNATGEVFETTPDGDIKPTIAVVGSLGNRALSRLGNTAADGVEVRIFAPDFHSIYDRMDTVAERIRGLLNGYHSGGDAPGIFQYGYRMGIRNDGGFENVAYDEISFDVMNRYARLEVSQ